MMIVSEELRKLHLGFDPEASVFLDFWDEPIESKVIELGSNNSPIAKLLAETGFDVTGIDLRLYDIPDSKHKHIVGDFLSMPDEWWKENRGKYDAAVCISAIEHFGLNAYKEDVRCPSADIVAARYIWDLLKIGGVFYVSVPFGGRYVEVLPHYRCYDWASLYDRIIQDFTVEETSIAVCEAYIAPGGRLIKLGETISLFDVLQNLAGMPYVSCLLRLRKNKKIREVKNA